MAEVPLADELGWAEDPRVENWDWRVDADEVSISADAILCSSENLSRLRSDRVGLEKFSCEDSDCTLTNG